MSPAQLPDFSVADDAGTLVVPPLQASRHMTLEDVTAQAMDRLMDATDSSLVRTDATEAAVLDAARAAVAHRDRSGHWDVCDLDALAEAVRAAGGAA